jgi:hypothetical protein
VIYLYYYAPTLSHHSIRSLCRRHEHNRKWVATEEVEEIHVVKCKNPECEPNINTSITIVQYIDCIEGQKIKMRCSCSAQFSHKLPTLECLTPLCCSRPPDRLSLTYHSTLSLALETPLPALSHRCTATQHQNQSASLDRRG